MIRIAQISDIHVADFADLRWSNLVGKRATGYYNFQRHRRDEYGREVLDAAVRALIEANPDLVVVSGDLSNLAYPSEWRAAKAALSPLADAGLRVSVIPGNHDYYVPSACRGGFEQVFDDWLAADERGTRPYPYIVRRAGVSVLHLNSAIPTAPVMAYGRVSARQLAAADAMLRAERERGQTLIAAVHHPLSARRKGGFEGHRDLRNSGEVIAMLEKSSVRLVMHGHNHESKRTRTAGGLILSGISSGTTRRTSPPWRRAEVALYEVDADGVARLGSSYWSGEAAAFGPWEWTAASDLEREPTPA